MLNKVIEKDIQRFLEEDDFSRHPLALSRLPMDMVECELKVKTSMRVAGLSWFNTTFNYLGAEISDDIVKEYEGRDFDSPAVINFQLPFAIALTGERVALNLLARASAVATHTKRFVDCIQDTSVKVLDTRKTTPGLRGLEKYAVVVGGGLNHRYGPTDMWMIKDNHKSFFGGVEQAINHFKAINSAYTPLELEVHDLKEFDQAIELGVKHVMLDNFSPEQVKEAISKKKQGITIEVSGGINLETIRSYAIDGVDFISVGSLTYGAPPVDLSLKFGTKL